MCAHTLLLGDDAGTTRVSHEREGFSLEVPDGWKTQVLAGALAFIAHVEGTQGFALNLNVSTASVSSDLETFVDLENGRAADYLTDLVVVEREKVTVAGRAAVRSLSRYRQGRFSVALEQWVVDDGARYVTLSGAAEESEWNQAAPTIKAIADSLTFF